MNEQIMKDTILGSSLRIGEPVVAVAHEVLEGWSSIRQVVRVGHILQEGLLGMAAQ